MSKVSKHFSIFILAAVLGAPAMRAQSLPPRIFFTDLTSGPNTGGENNNGTILTIYGKNFGTTQGTSTVTVGGGAVAAYLQWGGSAPGELGTQKISVAIGAAAKTGSVVVTTSNGPSNAIPFTVRSGNIYCVSTTGNDANAGQFPSSCWATPVKAKNTMVAGDITYILNGVTATTQDSNGGVVNVSSSGTALSPIALVGYPGASVTIGSSTQARAFEFPGGNAYWTIAGISAIRAQTEAFNMNDDTGIRIVGDDISCPNGDGSTACVLGDGGSGSGLKALGNYIHNTGNGCTGGCHTYHAFYNSTNNVSWEAGWNTIAPDPGHTGVAGCKAIEVYSTGGSDQFDIHIHDNIIHDAVCDGIDLNTVNPDGTNTMGGQGSVEVYDNIIYHVGTGPAPSGSESDYACIEVGATAAHTNPIQIYNNSFYDCGSRGNGDSGGISYSGDAVSLKINLRNNIFQATGASEPYFTSNSSSSACSNASGSNNLWFGAGAPLCGTLFTSNVNSDPKFVDPVTTRNFHLQSGSPAIDVGVSISTLLTDLDGVTRPQGPAFDIGAYEFVNGIVTVRPNPPTNLKAVVQ
jgi:hypothetical protein